MLVVLVPMLTTVYQLHKVQIPAHLVKLLFVVEVAEISQIPQYRMVDQEAVTEPLELELLELELQVKVMLVDTMLVQQ